MRSMTRVGLAALALCGTGLAGEAHATDWIVTVGARLQTSPSYEGAGHDVVLPVPTFALRRKGEPDRVAIPDDGYGLAILNARWIDAGPAIRLRGSRPDTGERAGLHKIDTAFEPGLFVNLWPADWLRLHAEERRGVAGHHGWLGDAALDLTGQSGPWTGSIGPRMGWGDRSYMEEYFGVTPAEAAASPVIHMPYDARSGMRYAGALATLAYRFSGRWQATADAGYHRLVGQASDSPIAEVFHARNEYMGGVGVKYSFGWSH